MRLINEIIVHCSATRKDWRDGQSLDSKIAEIKRWHVQGNGWSDIGYHFIVDRDGSVGRGRPVSEAGAHCRGRNAHSIGICLIGGHGGNANDDFGANFTPDQSIALRNLIDQLKREHPSIEVVSGHNQYANKACPCFNVPKWIQHKPERTSVMQSSTMQMSTAQILTGVTGGISAIAALDGTAQLIVIGAAVVVTIAAVIIMRERLKRWARGDR